MRPPASPFLVMSGPKGAMQAGWVNRTHRRPGGWYAFHVGRSRRKLSGTSSTLTVAGMTPRTPNTKPSRTPTSAGLRPRGVSSAASISGDYDAWRGGTTARTCPVINVPSFYAGPRIELITASMAGASGRERHTTPSAGSPVGLDSIRSTMKPSRS